MGARHTCRVAGRAVPPLWRRSPLSFVASTTKPITPEASWLVTPAKPLVQGVYLGRRREFRQGTPHVVGRVLQIGEVSVELLQLIRELWRRLGHPLRQRCTGPHILERLQVDPELIVTLGAIDVLVVCRHFYKGARHQVFAARKGQQSSILLSWPQKVNPLAHEADLAESGVLQDLEVLLERELDSICG